MRLLSISAGKPQSPCRAGANKLLDKHILHLLRCVAEDCSTHIAGVERDHAGNKRLGKQSLSIEHFIHRSALRDWMAAYIGQGGPDSTTVKRHAVKAALQARRQPQKAKRGGNGCLLYIAAQQRQLRSGSRLDGPKTRRELAAEYRSMTAAEKADWQARYQQERFSRQQQHRCQPAGQSLGPWSLGDKRWPLAASEVQRALGECRGSLHAAADCLRLPARKQMLIEHKLQRGWSAAKRQHATCSEKHPGLCQTLHADVYRSTCVAASQLYTAVKEYGGKFWRLMARNTCMATVAQRFLMVAFLTASPRVTIFLHFPTDSSFSMGPLRATTSDSPLLQLVTGHSILAELLQAAPQGRIVLVPVEACGSCARKALTSHSCLSPLGRRSLAVGC